METTQFPLIISVDDHTVEPADVWQDRLPRKNREVGPRIVRAPLKEMTFLGGRFKPVMGEPGSTEGPIGDWWVYEDLRRPLTRLDTAVGYDRDEVKLEVITYEQMRPGSYDVSARLADMDVNHVQSAVCFPTFPRFCGQTFTEAADKELALLCVRAYNDWRVEEWCGPKAHGRQSTYSRRPGHTTGSSSSNRRASTIFCPTSASSPHRPARSSRWRGGRRSCSGRTTTSG